MKTKHENRKVEEINNKIRKNAKCKNVESVLKKEEKNVSRFYFNNDILYCTVP